MILLRERERETPAEKECAASASLTKVRTMRVARGRAWGWQVGVSAWRFSPPPCCLNERTVIGNGTAHGTGRRRRQKGRCGLMREWNTQATVEGRCSQGVSGGWGADRPLPPGLNVTVQLRWCRRLERSGTHEPINPNESRGKSPPQKKPITQIYHHLPHNAVMWSAACW